MHYHFHMKNGPYELIVPPPDYPGKRYRERYAYEHRVNWWRETGLNPDDFPGTVIHHGDEAKRNNVPKNLKLMAEFDHKRHHARGVTMISYVCKNCEVTFERRTGREYTFCSRQCIGFYGFNSK